MVGKVAKGKDIYSWKIQIHYNRSKDNSTGTVAIAGTTYSRSDKKITSLTMADTVIIGDVRFKITSVSANAFQQVYSSKECHYR